MLRKLILKVSSILVSYYSSQKFLGSFKDKHSFYSSYNSCNGHENSQYFNIQRKKLASDLKKFTFIKNVRHQLVCMFIKLYFKNDLVHILDVGGVSSSIYHNLRALHINSKVICMDLPETVKNVKDLENNDLLFITSKQQEKKHEFDIIYFGSSIC